MLLSQGYNLLVEDIPSSLQTAPDSAPNMQASDVVALLRLLEDNHIDVWVDGGWGVDALLGEQTRPHGDLDIAMQQKDVPALRELLVSHGYQDVERGDSKVWNFVLGDAKGHLLDVHAVVFDAARNGLFGPADQGIMYPAASLTGTGTIAGYPVKCIAAKYVVFFHSRYDPRQNDLQDVAALCERFGIKYPDEYGNYKRR
ncbi:MAG: hypothetical protein P4L50_21730 [Anaerolineaceae bacterium]|nr:hypothetical protein [Anaerolineaceae bacterium]